MNTLTLQDVANLAKVRRPVVSMWRKRPVVRGVPMPFPAAVDTVAGVERFAPDDVVDYLQRTGRGNNPEAHLDAATIAVPDGIDLEEAVVLLAWCALTGEELTGTTVEYRTHRAAELDPDDTLLLREVRELDPSVELLAYIDDLREASFGLPDALARLEAGRISRESGLRDLTATAVELLSAVVTACAVHLGSDRTTLRTDSSALSLRVAADAGLSLVSGDRSLRRRAVITDVPIGQHGSGSTLTVVSAIGLGPSAVLDVADELVITLPVGHVGIVVGPAEALTDDLRGELQNRRATILRVENVVAALRLPRGYWREAHRQSLAVWVCVGGAAAERPWIGDLGAAGEPDLADLSADIAGALERTERRAYRYTRQIEVAKVRVSGPLVPRGALAPALRAAGSGGHLDAVHAATLVTSEPMDTLDVLVSSAPGRLRVHHRALGELNDEKVVEVLRGCRIRAEHASPLGTVVVLPAETVNRMMLDPIDAEQHYPRAVRTEPGDVIFYESPRPRAWVDQRGGAMVAAPARILRVAKKAEFGPRLLTAVINNAAAGSEWKTWAVPSISREESQKIESTLAGVERYRNELDRRIEAADALTSSLIAGVAAGAITLDAQPTTFGVITTPSEKGR
jgi:hypothetical protein